MPNKTVPRNYESFSGSAGSSMTRCHSPWTVSKSRMYSAAASRARSAAGPAAVIFVGALNVGSISTPWGGEIRPRHSGVVENVDLGTKSIAIAKGDLLGWFNMGSTVILLLPKGACDWRESLIAGNTLRMGEAIGRLSSK